MTFLERHLDSTVGKRGRVNWRGYMPAITTPFAQDRSLDLPAFARLLEWLHSEGMHGLLIAGTTGEWTSLAPEERVSLFNAAGAQMSGKLPLVAGCSALTADQVVAYAEAAAAAKLDGILVTPPPYVRPNGEEILAFYRSVSERTPLPLCIYNWPPGTGVDMPLSLLEQLADLDAVVALKQSTGDFSTFVKTWFTLKDKIRVFGHTMDEHGLALLEARGGDGTMGAGGILGQIQPDFYNHLWKGEIDQARICGQKDRLILDQWYKPDLTGRFGSGPAMLKAALNLQNLPGGFVRPPLLDVSSSNLDLIRNTLRQAERL